MDYEAGEATLGKPGGADLQLGLATGPALYAWEEHAEMGPLIERKFEQPGDVELVSQAFILFGPLSAYAMEFCRPGTLSVDHRVWNVLAISHELMQTKHVRF